MPRQPDWPRQSKKKVKKQRPDADSLTANTEQGERWLLPTAGTLMPMMPITSMDLCSPRGDCNRAPL